MMFIKSVLESIELSIELPMVLEMDNKGAVNLANNWLESSQKNTTCCIKQGSTFYKNWKNKASWKSSGELMWVCQPIYSQRMLQGNNIAMN